MTWRDYTVTTHTGHKHTVRALSMLDADWRARNRHHIDLRVPYSIERSDAQGHTHHYTANGIVTDDRERHER